MTDGADPPPPPTDWPKLPDDGAIDRILDIIAREAGIDRDALVPGATMATLNIASIDMVTILFEIEDKFDVYVPMGDELADTVYLGDLVKVFADQMQRKAAEGGKAD